ncbi:MAG: rubredoxin-like domain-containing protein [Candidatus Omnitrophota bacterium]
MSKTIKGAKTEKNLLAAFAGESQARNRYAYFASVAKKEGLEQIAKVENFHESRYRKLINNIASNEVFKKKTTMKWHCINCGYIFEGTDAPRECPACKHPQSYYEVVAENY